MKFWCPLPFLLTFVCFFTGGTAGTPDVLIIGGGPAAIHAAATLIENGITYFYILEEDSQLRGYLETVDFGGHTFEPGSLWAYSPIKKKLDERGIAYHVPDYFSYTVYNDAGVNVTREAIKSENALFEAIGIGYGPIIKDLDEGKRPDLSQKAAIARGGWIANTDIDKVMEWYNFDFNEGISPRDTSTIQPYRQANLFPDDYFILDNITHADVALGDVEALLSDDQIRLNQRVVIVNQTEDYVTVITEDGSEWFASYAIVTSTVGVIQNGGITFNPPLPPWKTEEFCRFQMGTLDPIFLKFDTKFWDDTEFILHASDRRGYYPVFLNLEAEGLHPAGTNILIGILTGDEAYRAELLTDDEVQAEVVEVLRNMYGASNVPEPTEFYRSRFAIDPSLYGSFATWPIGTIPEDAQTRLRAHIGRVYFAPEGAGDKYIGITFGAVNDGKAAAASIVACRNDGDCGEYTPVDPEGPPLCRDGNPNKRRKDFDAVAPLPEP